MECHWSICLLTGKTRLITASGCGKKKKKEVKLIDQSDLPWMFKAWLYQHGFLTKILGPLLYNVPRSIFENLEERSRATKVSLEWVNFWNSSFPLPSPGERRGNERNVSGDEVFQNGGNEATGCLDGRVLSDQEECDLCKPEPQQMKLLIQGVYNVDLSPSNLEVWGKV